MLGRTLATAAAMIEAMGRNIEIDDDPEYQRKTETIQRIGWGLMALFLIGVAAGLFGQSRLSTREITNGRITVKYDRFLRTGTESEVKVTALPQPGARTIKFWVPRTYLDRLEVEHALPAPETTRVSSEGIEFEYNVRHGGEPVEIVFTLRAQKPGSFRGEVAETRDSAPLEFKQFAYF